MAFEDLLVHTATTYRRSGARDEFNQPIDVQEGVLYLTGIPCRANVGSGKEQFTERTLDVIVDITTIYFPAGTDIREDDALEVFDKNGLMMVGPHANIINVSTASDGAGDPHHMEVDIQTVRGPVS